MNSVAIPPQGPRMFVTEENMAHIGFQTLTTVRLGGSLGDFSSLSFMMDPQGNIVSFITS